MAVTTSYTWNTVVASFQVNQVTGGGQDSPVVAAYQDGSYFVAWQDALLNPTTVSGRVFKADGSAITNEIQINTTTANQQFAPAVALVNGSTMLVAFADTSAHADGEIRVRAFDKLGNPLGPDSHIYSPGSLEPAVSGISNGNAAVTYTDDGGDQVRFEVVEPDGTDTNIGTGNGSVARFMHSAVAGLAGGGFVVALEKVLLQNGNRQMSFYRVTNDGHKLEDDVVAFDTTGTINGNPEAVGLKDGGFAIAYTDNGYNLSGTEISLMIFNADGSNRTSAPIRVNTTNTAGDQDTVSITTLSNGYIVVGWHDSGFGTTGFAQAFKPDGSRVGDNHIVAAGVLDGSLAGLQGGQLANVWASTQDDGDALSIRSSVDELTRTTTSDGANDTMAGGVDTLKDRFIGGGGTDTVTYKAAESAAVINLTNDGRNAGSAKGDTFTGVENLTGTHFDDKLTAGKGENRLKGLAGDDVLKGGKGGDTLIGGKGADKLYAGKGDSHDVFVFGKHDSGTADGTFDRIYGFDRQDGSEKVHDVIDISHLHVSLSDIDLASGKHSVRLLIDTHGSSKPDMAIELMKVSDLNPGDLLL